MVRLSNIQFGVMKTFGLLSKGKIYNHRKPIKYQRFQSGLDPEEIVAHYSRDDLDQLDPRRGQRTYKDATLSLGRKSYTLPNLSLEDLKSNELFSEELNRQRAIVARINKIRVVVDSIPGKDTELIMNKDISTPFDCARHIHDLLTSRSVVAEITPLEVPTSNEEDSHTDVTKATTDGEISSQLVRKSEQERSQYWDMHRPLEESCRLKFRHFTEREVSEVNKIYWRSCSFVLGMAIRLAFKDEIKVLLHSWPKPNIKSGSFVYDAALNLDTKWTPSEQELRAFTKIMWKIKDASIPFERLQVDREVAQKFFSSNSFKLSQIDSILSNESSNGKITVYRCGGLLDISVGPMIANTSLIGRITLAAVHPFDTPVEEYKGIFYRFQGVSLPQELPLSSYLYQNVLINQAKQFNKPISR